MDVLRTRPSIKEQQLRSRIEQTVNLKQLFKVIDSRPETSGEGVIYIAGDSTIISLRKFNSSCRVNPISIILKEPTSPMSADSYAKELKSSNRESKLASELIGAGLSCASAALGGWLLLVVLVRFQFREVRVLPLLIWDTVRRLPLQSNVWWA